MKRKRSIKTKVLSVLLLMQIPLIVIIIVYNLYFVNFFNQKISESNRNALKSYCDILERDLERLSSRMVNFIGMDTNFKMLSNDTDYLDAHVHSLAIIDYFNDLMEENELLYGCYIINHNYQIFRESYGGGGSYAINELLRAYFEPYLEYEHTIMDEVWQPLTIKDQSFLYMVRGYKGTYEVNIIDVSRVYMPQQDQQAQDGAIILFSGKQMLNRNEDVETYQIEFLGQDNYYFSGTGQKYLMIESPVAYSDIRSAYIMKYKGFMGSLSSLQRTVIILSVVIVIMILPIGYYQLKRVFFKPVDRLVETMDAVREGKMETRADEDYSESEFLKMNQTFNAMISEINTLKIESYEKELSLQRTQLDYFQTQIRPHFYVNCLKSVYGMLEEGRGTAAKDAVVYLSRHLRYMLKGPSVAVTLYEELTYVKNYIELQELSMAYPPRLHTEVEDGLGKMKMPAISILSFVENAVKYGGTMDHALAVSIYISRMETEDGAFINISISDNGPGFDEKLLRQLNNYEEPCRDGHRIGIYNVIQRFILYYGRDQMWFAFSNMDGAHVDIFIKDKGVWE